MEALAVAAKTGTLVQELRHQLAENLSTITRLTRRCGLAAIVIIKTLVFVALAHLLVSYYIPLLQFGQLFMGDTL